jgi:hypothetical protein
MLTAPGAPSAGQHVIAGTSVLGQSGGVAVGHADYVAVGAARPPVAGRPVRLPPRPAVLAGREQLLADLDAVLSGADRGGPRLVALCGLGGAGKTSVALEYAHRHLPQVGVAWQFAAEDPAVLAAGFGDLAAELGAREVVDARDPVASVHAVLASYPARWLLVFDNVPERASILGFVPPAGRGRVLVTCQNPAWPPGQLLEVPVLDTEIAADFLVSRTGDPDRASAVELAGQLGGLPLALEQAAAYVQATGITLAGYLASFRGRRGDLLARGEPVGYSGTVATAWSLAFDRIGTEPQAAGLLRLLAFCAPEAVPLSLLLQPRPGLAGQLGTEAAAALMPLLEDPLAVNDAVAALRRYSLITPAGDGSVSVHRLVQAVTAGQMSGDLAGQWRQAAASLIEAAIPGDTGMPRPGRPALRCCRTPGPPSPTTAPAWRGSRTTSASRQGTVPHWNCSGGSLAPRNSCLALNTQTPSTPGTSWPAAPEKRATRPRPATSSPRSCRSGNRC